MAQADNTTSLRLITIRMLWGFCYKNISNVNMTINTNVLNVLLNNYCICTFKCFSAQDCLAYMQTGSDLIKVRSNSRQYHRFFTLGSDMTEIRWQPTSKKPHKARSKYTRTTHTTLAH